MVVCRKNSYVNVGNGTHIHGDFWGKTSIHSKSGCKVVIGTNCLLSGNIVIRNNDGHNIVYNGVIQNKAEDIEIGSHVWICEGVHILKGCEIGANTVIGCASVVTKGSIIKEGNMVLAGNPAKCIRKFGDGETWER